MPFPGKWAGAQNVNPDANGNFSDATSSHPSVHPLGSGHWATDVYAPPDTEARLHVGNVSGTATYTASNVGDTSCGAGKRVRVNVKVDNVDVGWVQYEHLDTGLANNTILQPGDLLGTTKKWADSEGKPLPCYRVTSDAGVHLHVVMKNVQDNHSCYKSYGNPGKVLAAGDNLGILGSPNTAVQQACSTEITDPDPDGDTLPNSQDDCDNEYGPVSNHGCPLPPDTDQDSVFDPQDLARFNPGPPANRGFPTHQRTATGKFNGDNFDDLAIFYDYGNGHTRLWQFNGASDGLVNSPSLQWDSQPGNWPAAGMKNAVADVNSDGYDDVITFYDYGSQGIRAQGFYGTPNGLTGPQLRWYSGPGDWHWPAVHLVGGDFDGNGRGEIGAFYDYGNSQTKLWVFKDEGLGLEEGTVPAWDSGPNRWSWIAMKNTVTDVNGDGKDDIVSLYDFGNHVCAFVFSGSSSGISAPGEQPQWCSNPGTYWPDIQLVPGDFDGNSFGDVGLVYDYGNNVTRTWTMSGSPNGLTAPQLKWESNSWAWPASKWNSGDYNGDSKTDIGAFYDYGNSRTRHWVLYGTPTGPSNTPAEDWDSGPNNPVEWWRLG